MSAMLSFLTHLEKVYWVFILISTSLILRASKYFGAILSHTLMHKKEHTKSSGALPSKAVAESYGPHTQVRQM